MGLALLASGALAIACASDLEGGPEDYPGAYLPPGGAQAVAGGVSVAGGGTSAQGGSSGAPTVTAGAPSTGGPPDDPACLTTILSNYFCTGCHSDVSADISGGGLSLEGQNLGQRLSTTASKGACEAGGLIVNPNDPASSVFLKKVKSTQGCGDAMPPPQGLTNADDVKCIEDWIMAF